MQHALAACSSRFSRGPHLVILCVCKESYALGADGRYSGRHSELQSNWRLGAHEMFLDRTRTMRRIPQQPTRACQRSAACGFFVVVPKRWCKNRCCSPGSDVLSSGIARSPMAAFEVLYL